jgi:hypothetical protein
VLANVNQSNSGVNLNMQQPFYQTMAYRSNMHPTGNGVPHEPLHDMFFPKTPAPNTPPIGNDNGGGITEGIREKIARTLREFRFTPKGWG